MSAGGRVAAFCALLVAIFALAAAAGGAFGPAAADDAGTASHDAAAGHGHGHAAAAATAPAAASGGLRLVAGDTTFTPGRPGRLSFRVVAPGGATLRAFDTEQARRMHLIVVRRDLRRFQHLHPVQAADGSWSTPVTLPDAGVYHAFADFTTRGARQTLGTDLFAAGDFAPLALPRTSPAATTDGYGIALTEPRAGELRFAVTRAGRPVTDLQPYLGARGHLVMLRAGDLAYEHVHPLTTKTLAFETGAAQPGLYRLFLQFRRGGTVHTAAFTHAVAG
jgi:hypothetical protein